MYILNIQHLDQKESFLTMICPPLPFLFLSCFFEGMATENLLRKPRKVLRANRGEVRRPKSIGLFKALDFSVESDHEADSNGEYTSASLKKSELPSAFTICSAFSVESWATEFSNAQMFALQDRTGNYWAFLELYAAESQTEFW